MHGRTQIRVLVGGEIRRPDLELCFTRATMGAPELEIVVWLEVKHGTGPHDGQLEAYLEAQRVHGIHHGMVLLVAPRSGYRLFPCDEMPPRVPRLTWQAVASLIERYSANDVRGKFLVDELTNYLRGEGLMDPSSLTPVHLVALANYREALQALEAVCDTAAELMIKEGKGNGWEPVESGQYPGRGSSPVQRWWPYRRYGVTPPGDNPAWEWSWNFFTDSADILLDGRLGVPCFAAGITTDESAGVGLIPVQNQDKLRAGGFQVLDKIATRSSKHEYVWRVAYPEEFLAGGDIHGQGQVLATWVTKAFTDLQAAIRP